MPDNKSLANNWFLRANRDLEDAGLLFKDGGSEETICFLSHQAIEKYLKGFLVAKGKKPSKTHDLASLVNYCSQFDKKFISFKNKVKLLNPYYIEARYPLGPLVSYPREDAKHALEIAQAIKDFIEHLKTNN